MNDYRASLRKVGFVIIGIGLSDIFYMAYCAVNKLNYSSGLNIFAVIAGIFMVRGNLKVAKAVTFTSALLFSSTIGAFLLMPAYLSHGLLTAYLKVKPLLSASIALLIGTSLIVYLWTYRKLTSPAVQKAMYPITPVSSHKKPVLGFWCGGLILFAIIGFRFFVLNDHVVAKAKQMAEEQTGSGYSFQITSFRKVSSAKIWYDATVIAYNSDEIKKIRISWWEKKIIEKHFDKL